jgi:hypothetical protein
MGVAVFDLNAPLDPATRDAVACVEGTVRVFTALGAAGSSATSQP